jgi:hypothetical protein
MDAPERRCLKESFAKNIPVASVDARGENTEMIRLVCIIHVHLEDVTILCL